MQHEEFYIGWQAEAPPAFARMVRRSVMGLAILVPAIAVAITAFQNHFSSATFEFGEKTELDGVMAPGPFPFLMVEQGKDAAGHPVFQHVLLVGKGKFGYLQTPVTAVNSADHSDGRLKITGSLIYGDGKTALEVENTEVLSAPSLARVESATRYSLGNAVLRGEITDPKCLFGVMNPGQGKPHRDCAVRCIAGGIPPVLKVGNAEGEAEYYLLAGPRGEPLNEHLLDYVGDGVQICGRLEQLGDWLILYADPASIRRISKGALNPGIMCN